VNETDLQVRLQLDKAFFDGTNVYSSGESIRCLVLVENTGAADVDVNGSLVLGHEADPDYTLSFRVTGPDGLPVEPRTRFEEFAPEDEDFVTLAQDDVAFKYFNFNNETFSFATPGTYSIQAIYKNLFVDSPPGAWLGELASDPVVLQILP
jgi:hypothetical protein